MFGLLRSWWQSTQKLTGAARGLHKVETKRQRRQREASQRRRRPKRRIGQLWPVLRKVPGWLKSAVGFLLIVGSLMKFYPWLSLQKGERLSSNEPFGLVLNVTNDGYVPIRNVSVTCRASIDTKNIKIGSESLTIKGLVKSLNPGRSVSLPCDQILKSDLPYSSSTVEMHIEVSYDLWRIPLRRKQSFAVRGSRDYKGEWQWLFGG